MWENILTEIFLPTEKVPPIQKGKNAPGQKPLGTVTRFNFRNPHSFLYIEGENDDGEMVEWEVEMGAAVSMSRRGWTRETINPGDPIRVVGNPSRAPGTHGVCCAELTQPDGSPIQLVRVGNDEVPLRLVAVVPTTAKD